MEEGFEKPPEDTEIWGVEFGRLATRIEFDVYSEATDFATEVFELAEEEGYYPEVLVSGESVEIDIERDSGARGVEVARQIEDRLKNLDLE